MLEDKKEALKEPKTAQSDNVKSKAKTKDYTVIKEITLEKEYVKGSTISVEVGSDLEKYLVTNKFVNKHGISRSN